MTKMLAGAEDWRYIYTAGDERFWSYRVGGGGSLWALRDLDGRLLREYEAHTSWSTFKDYIYRGTQLLASSHSTEGTRHFHLDHLGTPRLVTAAGSGGDFYTLTPCRVLDTRTQSPLLAGETRSVPMAGICGIPSGAAAVAVNITAVDATSNGEVTAYPATESQPTASVISYQVSLNRANNAILKLGNGALAFYNNQLSGNVHLIIDVNGYFTEDAGAVVAYHAYYPFGEEATAFNQDAEQMKFTGHERDLGSLAGAGDDLDYMHARHYSPMTGRFLEVDPLNCAKSNAPQTWNHYVYSRNNPLRYLDPDGREEREGADAGTVFNFTAPGNVVWVVGEKGGKTYTIPLDYGERSDTYLTDTDAIIIIKGNPIEGETEGAFKLGGSDVDVEYDEEGGMALSRDGEYFGYFVAGRAGYFDASEAAAEKWVAPQTEEEIAKAMSDKEKIRGATAPNDPEPMPQKEDDN